MNDERTKIEPTTVSREELHRLVWETPMIRLGERFGISGNGLAKICRRLDIPYPPRGHWAKKAAGHKVTTAPVPPAKADTPASVRISPTEPEGVAETNSTVQQALDDARNKAVSFHVPERLNRPHAIIVGWLADHERRKQEAKRERDPWRRDLVRPAEFSDQDRRRHRILDALFKELERQGARIIQGDYRALSAEVAGEKIEFELREKQKQIRRPLTEKEREREPWNKKGVKQELQPSGFLVFAIKTYLVGSLRREWLEKAGKPMEELLPEIVATFIAAGPLLAEQRRSREEQARLHAIAEQRREQERQKRKQDQNRWRRLVQIAGGWREVEAARDFIAAMRALPVPEGQLIEGQPIEEWLVWAEQHLESANPLSHGVEGIFKDIAQVQSWTYRD
jgi:hypothetical protein